MGTAVPAVAAANGVLSAIPAVGAMSASGMARTSIKFNWRTKRIASRLPACCPGNNELSACPAMIALQTWKLTIPGGRGRWAMGKRTCYPPNHRLTPV